MKRLIIVRHGNTFRPGETPLRVGRRTDLPLVEEERAAGAGRFLLDQGLVPDRVFAAPLRRTMRTAEIILRTMNLPRPVEPLDIFSEIDYGPDEGKPEDEVVARLGRDALDDWNARAVPPDGWIVDPAVIVANWRSFVAEIPDAATWLVVSSNGILRFAPQLLDPDDYRRFLAEHDLKVATGGVGMLECDGDIWSVRVWNRRAK